jgi:hypothetical protein
MFKMRDHVRTIGLINHFWLTAAPLHAPKVYHHPTPHYPDLNALGALRPVFSYLPVCLSVLRLAAARLCRLQSLPVRHDLHVRMVTIS